MKSLLLIVIIASTVIASSVLVSQVATTFGCQTNARGCQKTQEAGTPAGDSPPEVSGCHFFDTQQCVRESTPP